jgi:hypothetical protein
MEIRDLIGVFAYTQVSALLESILLLGIFVILSIVLPKNLLKDCFVVQGTILVFIAFLWGAFAYYQARILQHFSWSLSIYLVLFSFWIISFFASVIGLSILARRNKKFADSIQTFVEGLVGLSVVYFSVDVLSLFFVIFRNLI